MKKIGVIGDKASVLCFMAAGFTAFVTEDAAEAAAIIRRAEKEDYAVLYVTEPLLEQLGGLYQSYKSSPDLALIPLPSLTGSTGFGMAQIKSAVERAVGADILK